MLSANYQFFSLVRPIFIYKGDKDRLTTLPSSIFEDLETHLAGVKKLHEADLDAGHGDVYLSEALAKKDALKGRDSSVRVQRPQMQENAFDEMGYLGSGHAKFLIWNNKCKFCPLI